MRYIVAMGRVHADQTAVIDWNWKSKNGGWIDHEGKRVEYLASHSDVMKIAKGTIIYLGYRYFANTQWSDLRLVAEKRGIILRKPADWSPNSLPKVAAL